MTHGDSPAIAVPIPHSPSHRGSLLRFRGTGHECVAALPFARSLIQGFSLREKSQG
ncbi:MAG: hypothetical protein LBK01_04115 [Burkholderiaceae bacterium]|nr:hypothetical protein [Burkholderiaceae bacterium]